MKILYLLIIISLVLVSFALFAFRWAVRNRQFDDLESPAMIPLMDDTPEEQVREQAAGIRKNRERQEPPSAP